MSEDVIRLQWNEAAKSWTGFIRSGNNYYSEHMNGPATERMIGDVRGKRVLDIACGEGFFSRYFAKAGAEVTGIDISEALIKAAMEEEQGHPLGVEYLAADAAKLDMLDSESFDLACCYMALMDMADYERMIAEASRVLKTGGRLVITLPHPCFSTRFVDGRTVAGWETRLREDGSKEYLHYRIEDYNQRHSFTFEWKHDRLPSSFVTTGFHRTLSDVVSALVNHGFAVTGLDEPQPMEEGVRALPSMGKHYRVPHSMVIEATKIT